MYHFTLMQETQLETKIKLIIFSGSKVVLKIIPYIATGIAHWYSL